MSFRKPLGPLPRFLMCLFAAPLVFFYVGLILFFYINGVTGADSWVAKLWNHLKGWWMITALLTGLILWIVLIIKFLAN